MVAYKVLTTRENEGGGLCHNYVFLLFSFFVAC
jgi:hypothetical protein